MRGPTTDASPLYRARDAIAAVDALTVAIVHLDLFTALAGEPMDVHRIAERFGLHPRPTDALLTLLAAHGYVAPSTAGRFEVTAMAREFLVAGSAFDARAYFAAMAEKPGVSDFLRVLRTDRPANWPGEAGEADWHAAMRTPAFAEAFTAAMDCRGRVLAPSLAESIDLPASTRVLDVGGGSGVYAIALAERFAGLRATVFETPPIDAIARRTIDAAGLSSRIHVLPGDMFLDRWPTDHDVHLFSNVLHDWDEPECRRLLAESVRSLASPGLIVVHDMLLDDDKCGPPWAAEYAILLATVTQGRLYSAAEIGRWLGEHGFRLTVRRPSALGRCVAIFARN